jgi:hypothetical protein
VALDVFTTGGSVVNRKGINSAGLRFRVQSCQEILVVGSGLSRVQNINRTEISSYEWRNVEI